MNEEQTNKICEDCKNLKWSICCSCIHYEKSVLKELRRTGMAEQLKEGLTGFGQKVKSYLTKKYSLIKLKIKLWKLG